MWILLQVMHIISLKTTCFWKNKKELYKANKITENVELRDFLAHLKIHWAEKFKDCKYKELRCVM